MDSEKRKRTEYESHREGMQGCRGILINPSVVFVLSGLFTASLCLSVAFQGGFRWERLACAVIASETNCTNPLSTSTPAPPSNTPVGFEPIRTQIGQTQTSIVQTETAIPQTQIGMAITQTQLALPTQTAIPVGLDTSATQTAQAATRTAFAAPPGSGTPTLPYTKNSAQTGTGKQVEYTVLLEANEALVGTAVTLIGNPNDCVVFRAIGPGTVRFQIADGSWEQYASVLSPRDLDYLLDKWFRIASQSCTPTHPEVLLQLQ